MLKDAASASLYGNSRRKRRDPYHDERGQSNKLNVRLNTQTGRLYPGIANTTRLGPDDWMETMFNVAYNDNYAYYLARELPQTLPTNSDLRCESELIPYYIQRNIHDAADDAVFDDNGKVIANVLPGYDDLDWLTASSRRGIAGVQHPGRCRRRALRCLRFAFLPTEDGYIKQQF